MINLAASLFPHGAVVQGYGSPASHLSHLPMSTPSLSSVSPLRAHDPLRWGILCQSCAGPLFG